MCERHEAGLQFDEEQGAFVDARMSARGRGALRLTEGLVADLERPGRAACGELERLEPVVSAAVLVTTAFRLRDEAGLIDALRLLVAATETLERDD